MPRRRIGRATMFGAGETRSSLDELAELIDWVPIERQLEVIYSAPRGEASWPPLSMFRGMLLAIWHDLSDVKSRSAGAKPRRAGMAGPTFAARRVQAGKLADALDDRTSFRRFCGFARTEPTPERTAFVRFRRELLRHGLDQVLFDEITAQLKTKAIRVKTGTLVDATVVGSVSESDGDARWSGHRLRKAIHGDKAHVGAPYHVQGWADTALVEKVAVTPGNAHDGRNDEAALPDNPGDVFADSAYRGAVFREAVRARGGTPRVVVTHVWAKSQAEADRWLAEWNGPIHQVRCRIEKIFGTWKRSYGFRRMRWRGIAKAHLQACLTAIAYNLKRTRNILMPAQQAPLRKRSGRKATAGQKVRIFLL